MVQNRSNSIQNAASIEEIEMPHHNNNILNILGEVSTNVKSEMIIKGNHSPMSPVNNLKEGELKQRRDSLFKVNKNLMNN